MPAPKKKNLTISFSRLVVRVEFFYFFFFLLGLGSSIPREGFTGVELRG